MLLSSSRPPQLGVSRRRTRPASPLLSLGMTLNPDACRVLPTPTQKHLPRLGDGGSGPTAYNGDQSHETLESAAFHLGPNWVTPHCRPFDVLLKGCSAVKILPRDFLLQQSILTLQHLKVLEKRPASLLRLILGGRREEQQLLSTRQTSLLGKSSPCQPYFLCESCFPSLSLQPHAIDAVLHTTSAIHLSSQVLSHLLGTDRLTNWFGMGFFIKEKLFWWTTKTCIAHWSPSTYG